MYFDDHCYCAICGVPCSAVSWDWDGPASYNPDLIGDGSVDWLMDIGLLSANRRTGEAFICHYAEHEGGRVFNPIVDPHSPETGERDFLEHPDNFGRGLVEVYKVARPGRPTVIPFHADCYNLLLQAVGQDLNLNVLYTVFSSRCQKQKNGQHPVALNYDYDQATKLQNNGEWQVERGTEFVVMNPDYVYLPQQQVLAMLFQAQEFCREFGTSSDEEWWMKKIHSEMGWLFEFFPSPEMMKQLDVTWRAFYYLARDLASGKDAFGLQKVRQNLRNRARVWRLCAWILHDYKKCLQMQKSKNSMRRSEKLHHRRCHTATSASIRRQ